MTGSRKHSPVYGVEQPSPQQVLADIRAGASDDFLLQKHGLDKRKLQGLLQLFTSIGALNRDDLARRSALVEKAETEDLEKYKQLFLMAEAAFKDEDERYNRLEDTAHKYVPVMLFLISVEGYFAKWVIDKVVIPNSWLDYLGILFVIAAFATLIAGGTFLFRGFRYEDVRLFRPDKEVVEFFDTYDLSTIYRAYAVKFNQERELNSQITEEKIGIRLRAYRLIVASFVFLVLTGVVFVIHALY